MACVDCSGCVPTECDQGFYGSACNLTCSAHCRTVQCASCTCAVCNVTSGYCLHGCDVGWYGELCQNNCPEKCSVETKFSGKCEQDNGACLYGCMDGFFGSKCNETCDTKCGNTLCNQTTGACMTGCVNGFKGVLCRGGFNTLEQAFSGGLRIIKAKPGDTPLFLDTTKSKACKDRVGSAEDNQVAGAVGGAFVIILWGVIVVILICFIRRRRQKEYEAFTRNRSLNSGRGSSRRQLQRQASTSSTSMPPAVNDVDQCYEIQSKRPGNFYVNHNGNNTTAAILTDYFVHAIEESRKIVIPDFESHPRTSEARRLFYVRSYSDESPVFHLCAHHEEMELRSSFRKKCSSVGNRKQYEHSDDDGRSRDIIRPMSSDEDFGDSNEMTEMWNVRMFRDHDHSNTS